jgi:hypothetical protein
MQTARKDSMLMVDLVVNLTMKHRPFKLKVGYSGIKGKLVNASSPFASGVTESSISLQWAAFQDTAFTIPISFFILARDSTSIREHVEASFIEEPVPVKVEASRPSSIIRRTYFARQTVFTVK